MKKIYQETLKKILNKYQIYEPFISLDELKKQIQKNFQYSGEAENIDLGIAMKMEMDDFVFYYLCQQAKENIDLEIFMIEKLTSICNIIYRKVVSTSFHSERKREDTIIKAIESYDGKISFSLHLTRVIKRETKEIHEPLSKTSQNKIEIKKNEFKEQEVTNKEKSTIIDKIEEYRKKHTISKEHGYFEYIFHSFFMADFIQVEDVQFRRYLLLKNGYYEGLYFTNQDIQVLLKESEEQIKKYQIQSLEILKERINQLFDQASIFIQKTNSLTLSSVNK